MKRLRIFFAVTLFLFFFPFWRGLDYQVMVLPSSLVFSVSLTFILLMTVAIPVRLLFPKIRKLFILAGLIMLFPLIWYGSPLSGKATMHYELRHCGLSTYAGLFYPIRSILLPAHEDDLEVRNQMCWIRKMIVRMPEEIDDVKELQNYLDLLRQKLLSPPNKYKAALPLIAFLHGSMSASISGTALESVQVGKMFVDSLHFWKGQYTVEINAIEYPWYAWPHSSFIQFEYGLIEKNWESLVEGIKIESN